MEQQRKPYILPLEEAENKLRTIQKVLCMPGKGMTYVNSFEPAFPPRKTVRPDGTILYNDLCYDKEYPNGYLDIWCRESKKVRPTLFYFHGGGMFMGHKHSGDPLAVEQADKLGFFGDILDRGYNIVNVDYALSPDYKFPVQFVQIDRAFDFINRFGAQYGLNTEHIFISGASAGANFTEIYGLAVENREYAKKIGLEKVSLMRKQLCGLIIEESALSVQKMKDGNMSTMYEGWLGEEDIEESEIAAILDVPNHIRDFYPPSVVIESNVQHFFPDSARDLCRVLERIGARYIHIAPEKEKGAYDHGFLTNYENDAYVRGLFFSVLDFMDEEMARRI